MLTTRVNFPESNARTAVVGVGGTGCQLTRSRVCVVAYVSYHSAVASAIKDFVRKFDADLHCVDNLNRVFEKSLVHRWADDMMSAPTTYARFAARHNADLLLFLVDHDLSESEKATLSGLVMSRAALVVGPKSASDFTWHLKAEAISRGRIFEVAESPKALERLLETSILAVHRMRYEALPATPTAPELDADVDELATLPGVVEVSHTLRSERGRLDAEKVRALFGLTRADLARLFKILEETIRQTPDSERLQPPLRAFERVARLLVLYPDRSKFGVWLNSPNEELEQRSPLELIKEGRIDVVETLVHDILTNRGR